MDTEEIVARLKEFACGRDDIIAIYLFGSQARGEARPDSDTDIAVLVRQLGRDLFDLELRLDVEIGKYLSGCRAETLILNRLPLPFQFEVIATGRLLYSADEYARTDWEVQMMSQYWDLHPFLAEYDRAFIQRIKEGFTDAQRQEYERARATFARTH